MTDTTAARPIDLLRGILDGTRHAIRLTKEGRTAEATEHVDAIDRLTAAYRNAVGTQPQAEELHHLRQESLLLRSLATEFHVPLTNTVVVRRLRLGVDRWSVTDAANTNSQVWIDGEWRLATDLGMDAAHPYSLDEALKTAHQLAEFESATYEAWVKAAKDAYEYRCPRCDRWGAWDSGRGTQYGDEVDEFWCQVCGTESRITACERRPARGDRS